MAGSLAKSFAARMGGATRLGVKSCVLTHISAGIRSPSSQSAGTNPTTTLHTCRAFVGTFETTQLSETSVRASDRMICIFAATVDPEVKPEPGDKLEIDGQAYRIVGGNDGMGVSQDPAGVLISCHARGL